MINLEWYRTFKAVYKLHSYSKAAEELFLTQPAVSNQMNMLEAAVGHKLFTRKSKGVEPTDHAKFLNNLIIESLDTLEKVESSYSKSVKKEERDYTFGISENLYKSFVSDKILTSFKYLTVHFENDNKKLFDLVNQQQVDAGIIRGDNPTFDVLTHKIASSKLVIVGHPKLDRTELDLFIKNDDELGIQNWLEHQVWFSHMAANPFIKKFWMYCFNKRRPKIFTNYIIPNEYFMLEELTKIEGVAVVLKENAKSYIEDQSLQLIWESDKYPTRDYYLIAHKKQEELFEMLKQLFGNE
ncbi:LysR family transcriptional regulator [Flammeovirga yaeyamensis]|uniref:LysR family transcriptional regulator n=1 Tax=Flammeovirga yaeyamensis TaxID=367791 RepID=A0AAX1NCP0_9BACT|nr:LysR family transcriptional regulator [Flammeovirga yaeyamensis]MBB3696814.1 DNA-binding transcriptional LysR family regulator [Flammeovirga yaeyamensis]NMF33479.1 LysR family transcriptional regulator [Flammeovirga yaeyamensis]QWG05247.1 LysR family transcriptional regulator [Flammeovirga yaeyamensis]